jgi:fibronectin-binding autotransporter adhesin
MNVAKVISSGSLSDRGYSKTRTQGRGRASRSTRSRQMQMLSLAAAGIVAMGSTARAVDTADNVNLTATTALDTTTNYSTNALPTTTNDMVFTNGTYTNANAFTLNTTALTPGTLDDLDTTQTIGITGSKSITLKTLSNGVYTANAADLLYVANGATFNASNQILLGVTGGNFDIQGTANLSGNINGSTATYTLAKTGAGTLNLSGTETYTGATILTAGTLNLNFAATGAPASNILLSTDPMTLQNGTLNVTGATGGTNYQNVGAVTLNNAGLVAINAIPGTSGTTSFTMASLTRTANVNTDAAGGAVQFGKTGAIFISGTTNSAILLDSQGNPFATYGLDDWAATSSTGQVIAAVPGTAYLDFNTSSTSTLSGNALRLSNTLSTGPITLNPGNVTSTARGILVTSYSAGGTIGATTNSGFLRPNRVLTGGVQFLVAENAPAASTPGGIGDLTINSAIAVASSSTPDILVKTGPGRLILTNTGNAQSRDFIDGGLLSVAADADLGAAGGDLVFEGGTLEVTNSFTPATNRTSYLNANSGISVTGSAIFTDPGLVTGLGSLTKTGTGTLVLSDANSYAGGTFINAGTLTINGLYAVGGGVDAGVTLNGGTLQYVTNVATANNGGADISTFGNGVTVGAGGGSIDLNGNSITYAGTIHSGGGQLNIVSSDSSHAGVFTLSGTSSLPGGIAVNSGTLSVTGSLGSTPVSVNTGGTLLGTGNAGAVNLAGGTVSPGTALPYTGLLTTSSLAYNSGAFTFGIGTSTAGNISTGSAVFNAKPNFNFVLSGSPTSGSVYTIISSGSTIVDNGYLTGLTPTTIGRLTLTPSESPSDTSIIVTLTGSAGNLVWNNNAGAGNGLWDIQTDANFFNTGTSAQDLYYEGDNVTFNDSNSGSYNVTLSTTVNPGSVTVNNNTSAYTFSGAAISGGTSLTKYGSNILILANTNSYIGGTIINAGTIQTAITNALPTSGSVTVQGTGTLDLDGNNATIGGLSDGGVSTGTITSSAGNPILTLNSSAATNSFSGTISGSLGLNKIGTSTFTMSGSNSYTGLTNVSNGTLVVASNSALGNSNSTTGGLYTTLGVNVNFTTAAPAIASLAGTGGTVYLAGTSGTTLTVGGGNATTTFAGTLTDNSATTSTAIGNLTVVGSGNLILTGSNTFTGTTIIAGTSTLTVGNTLALENTTLNYNGQGGTLAFAGNVTAATLGALTGSQTLTLNNTNSTAVTLTVGTNNTSTTYSGNLTGTGGLSKAGTGAFTLSGTNTYTGNTSVNNPGGTLILTGVIGGGASQGSINVAENSTLNVSGGTLVASAMTTGANAGASTVNVINGGTINVSAGTINTNSDNGATGYAFNVLNGTVLAGTLLLDRNATVTGPFTTDPNSGGFTINGSNAVVTVLGALNLDTSGNGDNSDAELSLFNGSLTVSGLTNVTLNTTARTSVIDVAGGTFNAAGGVQLGGTFTNSAISELLIHGGVTYTPSISMGASGTTTGTELIQLEGGTLYVGAGGIVNNSGGTATTINLGSSTAYTTAPTLAASASWSTTLPMTLSNSSSGLPATIQTADQYNNPFNITLTGALNGSGGLTKTGGGDLILNNSSNAYTGPTNVSTGTLVDAQNTILSHTSSLNINGSMIIQNSPSLSSITKQVAAGFNGGTWNGTNNSAGIPITSSAAASDTTHLHALGVILNDNGTGSGTQLYASFEGYSSLNDSDVLIKYTYYGDTDLNGEVDGSDYSRIDYAYEYNQTHSSAPLTGWFNGDFNYDGVIDGSDYTLIDNAFNSQGAQISGEIASPTAQIASGSASSAVPEPTTLGLLGIGAVGLLGRRRRRHR